MQALFFLKQMEESFLAIVLENQKLLIPQFIFLAKKEVFKKEFAEIVQEMKQFLVKNYIIQQ